MGHNTHNTIVAAICGYVTRRHNAHQAVPEGQSLFYSGLVDSLGIQELCAELERLAAGLADASLRVPLPSEIVENDLDTPALIAAFMTGERA